ncbi:MAG: 2-dehydropantoate 2-reductase [Desulfobulbaceae bacterium]|nr:2-dehydropantoate 2-reductase [Desulfobulbaceae bacterium]
MKFVIVGAGAIGRLFGTMLCRGNHEVTFVEPLPEVVDAINQQGIGIMGMESEDSSNVSLVPAKAVSNAQEISSCDFTFLAVKSYNTLPATKSISHLVSEDSPILTLQTGLDNIEVIEKIVPKSAILGGYTFMGGTALGPGIVRLGGTGKTYIGELDGSFSPRLEKLHTALNDSKVETEMVERIIGRLWCKVIVFSAINPVAAIVRQRNGLLLEKIESVNLMKRLIDEGKAVADACSIDLVYHELYDILYESCKRTANNLSPMLQDLINDKRTEIDSLNGALCRYGAKKGLSLPTHHTVIQIIKLLEKWGHFYEQG